MRIPQSVKLAILVISAALPITLAAPLKDAVVTSAGLATPTPSFDKNRHGSHDVAVESPFPKPRIPIPGPFPLPKPVTGFELSEYCSWSCKHTSVPVFHAECQKECRASRPRLSNKVVDCLHHCSSLVTRPLDGCVDACFIEASDTEHQEFDSGNPVGNMNEHLHASKGDQTAQPQPPRLIEPFPMSPALENCLMQCDRNEPIGERQLITDTCADLCMEELYPIEENPNTPPTTNTLVHDITPTSDRSPASVSEGSELSSTVNGPTQEEGIDEIYSQVNTPELCVKECYGRVGYNFEQCYDTCRNGGWENLEHPDLSPGEGDDDPTIIGIPGILPPIPFPVLPEPEDHAAFCTRFCTRKEDIFQRCIALCLGRDIPDKYKPLETDGKAVPAMPVEP